jgi:hypothetical protein
MSLFVNSPIVSLSPLYDEVYQPVSLMPLATDILLENRIVYDPFRTFSSYFPLSPVFYTNYPDLNTDLKIQKKVYNKLWDKLENKWIFDFTKVFKYINGKKNNYELVSSLTEAENNKYSSEDVEGKAEWFLSNVYKKSDLANTIEKYRKKAGINLWDVEDDKETLKAFIYHQIKRMLFNKLT